VVPSHVSQWGFVLQPDLFSNSGNDFIVTNQDGRPIVMVRGKKFSLHDKRIIFSAKTRQPLLYLEKKLLGVHHTYHLIDPVHGEVVIGTIRKRLRKHHNHAVFELFRGEGTDRKDLIWTMQGDFYNYKYFISDDYGLVARAGSNPHIRSTTLGKNDHNNDPFFVEVASGVEALLVLALCLVAEETRAEEIQDKHHYRNR
jgi:uncharacterized protein YxjI